MADELYMGASRRLVDPIKKLVDTNETDYHVITTDHPYMVELGLGVFTTGTLYRWWNQTVFDKLVNRMTIDPREPNSVTLNRIIGGSYTSTETNTNFNPQYFWDGWKPDVTTENTGRYQRQGLEGFYGSASHNWSTTLVLNGRPEKFSIGDIVNKFKTGDIDVLTDSIVNGAVPSGDSTNFLFYPRSMGSSFDNAITQLSQGLGPTFPLINLNRFMVDFKRFEPRDNWFDGQGKPREKIRGFNSKELFASDALLSEIKSAQAGPFVQWSGEITFNVNELRPGCQITEWIPFKLFLFDQKTLPVQQTNIGLSTRNLIMVGPKTTSTGREFSLSVDGTWDNFQPEQSPATLDLSYDTVSNNWTAGTQMSLAVLHSDVGPAKYSSKDPEEINTREALVDENVENRPVVFSDCLAIPYTPQNGNPYQWAANYHNPESVRCSITGSDDSSKQELLRKEKVRAYNSNPSRGFKKGEVVNLFKNFGSWFISPIETQRETVPESVTSDLPWGEFTYFMTNNDHFFKYYPVSGVVGFSASPRFAEIHFHRQYYAGFGVRDNTFHKKRERDAINNYVKDYGPPGGYDGNFNSEGISSAPWKISNNFFQTTSFDYLDQKIMGMRGLTIGEAGVVSDENNRQLHTPLGDLIDPELKGSVTDSDFNNCSISHTNANRTADGKTIPYNPADYPFRNAAHCGVFFGCIFPGGYTGFSDYKAEREWEVKLAVPSLYNNNLIRYIGGGGPIGKVGLPFEDETIRNNCRQATSATKDQQLDAENAAWSRFKQERSAGIFSDQDNLNSMPADVMLNASPTSKIGAPFYPIHRFKGFNDESPTNLIDTVNYTKLASINGAWLYKHREGDDPQNFDDSAFGFKPNDPSTIMFRPLKLENYVQFSELSVEDKQTLLDNTLNGVLRRWDSRYLGVGGEDGQFFPHNRTMFSTEAHRTQLDLSQPASNVVLPREGAQITGGLTGDYGLRWGGEVLNPVSYNYLHKFRYWGRGPFDALHPSWAWPDTLDGRTWNGAHSFGVITTYKTVSATNSITLRTTNRYGMGAAANGAFRMNGGWFGTGFGSRNGFDRQDISWGTNGGQDNTYREPNISALVARVYHHHPRDQTLFDPRTFAVHHFNPGLRYAYDLFMDNDGKESGVLIPTGSGRADNGSFYKTYEDSGFRIGNSSADIRVLSRYQEETGEAPFDAVPIPTGTLIFVDATEENAGRKPKVIEQAFYPVDRCRIGKLLPYAYDRNVIGIPKGYSELLTFSGGMVLYQNVQNKLAKNVSDLVVTILGSGYRVGDIVGNKALNIQLQVIELSEGLISELKVINRGVIDNVRVKYEDTVSQTIGSAVTVNDTIQSEVGAGFRAFFTHGKVYGKLFVDPKPTLIRFDGTDNIHISSKILKPQHATSNATNAAVEGEAFVNDLEAVTVINVNKDALDFNGKSIASADGKYDVFLHFHNDITMTWLASNQDFHGDRNNAAECAEQYITLNIATA